MDVTEFLESFFKGTLGRKKTHGEYSVYSSNLLTGEEFSSNILMRDPVKIGRAENPVWIGSYYGDGVALIDTTGVPRDWNRSIAYKTPLSPATSLVEQRGVYFGNLRGIWGSHDITEAGLVDVNGEGAVLEFEGVDYLLYEFPKVPTLASMWLQSDVRGLRRLTRLDERCGTVQEAKALVMGDIDDKSVLVFNGILTPTDEDYDFQDSDERATCPHPAGYSLPKEWWPTVGETISLKQKYGGGNDSDKVMLLSSIQRYNQAVTEWLDGVDMKYAERYGFEHWQRWDHANSHPIDYGDDSSGFGCLLQSDEENIKTPGNSIAVKFNAKTEYLPGIHKGWWLGRHIGGICV